jgi:DNA mismatch repair protein MutL
LLLRRIFPDIITISHKGEEMMSLIRVLPEDIINRIAAGEVVENPASVVKELVENSLDAQSSQIRVEIFAGGQQLIRIIDNGVGMGQDDAILSLERHATSKIRKFDDLFTLESMGFRGEALAAIASVSKMSITTALENSIGTQIEVEGGKILRVSPSARKKGTTIEVRSLFYNVPARKKFQKSSAINGAEVLRLITTFSLAYPHIAFELFHNDELVFSTSDTSKDDFKNALESRVCTILGEEVTSSSYFVDFTEDGYVLKGYIGNPLSTRHNRSGQYLFVHQRAVVSPLISYAVRDGFGTRLAEQRHPIYVIHLEMPKALIDVNVHPQKKEVRFRDENIMKQKVEKAIKQALGQKETSFIQRPIADIDFTAFSSFPEKSLSSNYMISSKPEVMSPQQTQFVLPRAQMQVVGLYKNYLFIEGASVADRISLPDRPNLSDVLIIVDLAAAFAQVLFTSLFTDSEKIGVQALLLPLSLQFSEIDASIVKNHSKLFEELGIFLHATSKNSYIIDKAPALLEMDELFPLVYEIVDELRSFGKATSISQERKREIAMRASLSAKTHKRSFTQEEAVELFEKLLTTDSPYHCPQGKPTITGVYPHDIAESFFRRKKS